MWNKLYNLIANVNIILRNVDAHSDVFIEDNYRICKGEALALRAFLHFDLLRLFGQSYATGANTEAIPYVENLDLQITPLSSVEDVLDNIIRDLEEAVSLMENDPIATGEASNLFLGNRQLHLNYYGAKALLARAYLYKGDKPNALQNAQDVIESEKYPWTDREEITVATSNNRNRLFMGEVIFALNNNKVGTYVDEFLRTGASENQLNVLTMNAETISSIYESTNYGNTDYRYLYLFEENHTYSNKLWQLEDMPEEWANRQPLIRISEMYLIAAEGWLDEDAEKAKSLVETMRKSRFMDVGGEYKLTSLDSEVLLSEMRREYLCEGQMFFAYKRLHHDILRQAAPGNIKASNEVFVLPIPEVEEEYGNR